jgi:hypothetical protein
VERSHTFTDAVDRRPGSAPVMRRPPRRSSARPAWTGSATTDSRTRVPGSAYRPSSYRIEAFERVGNVPPAANERDSFLSDRDVADDDDVAPAGRREGSWNSPARPPDGASSPTVTARRVDGTRYPPLGAVIARGPPTEVSAHNGVFCGTGGRLGACFSAWPAQLGPRPGPGRVRTRLMSRAGRAASCASGAAAGGPGPVCEHGGGGGDQGGGERDQGDLPARHATGGDHVDDGGRDRCGGGV